MRTGTRYFFLLLCFLISFFSDLNATGIKTVGEVDLSYIQKKDSTPCYEIECNVFLHVIRSRQKLYFYENGALIDSFSVSTGNKRHPTPDINMRPDGPTYIKYSSKKYPGGNYEGL